MRLLILFFTGILLSCQQRSETPDTGLLRVTRPTSLRQAPDEKSAELEILPVGVSLIELGKVSRMVSDIFLNDTLFQEPWIQAQTKGGHRGWVYAAAVQPEHAGPQEAHRWLLHQRLNAWFGPALAQRWQRWTAAAEFSTDTAFSIVLREGLSLRDTLNQLMARQLSRSSENTAGNFFWLGETTPLFAVQQMAPGHGYRLFLHYGEALKIAKRTRGLQDELFVRAGLTAFPADSIESLFPAWVFPLSLETSCSNLGEGRHLLALLAIDQAWRAGTVFQPELHEMKDAVLADILDRGRDYWQPGGKILRELEAIKKAPLACLEPRDRLALDARQKMFEAPESNGLKINLRAGS